MLRLPVRKQLELEPATVEAARRGEGWAQALVVDRYAKPVWSLVCRILGRAGRRPFAEDATQDALVAALRSLPRFRTDLQGVTMHRPNEDGYHRRGVYVLDDWR